MLRERSENEFPFQNRMAICRLFLLSKIYNAYSYFGIFEMRLRQLYILWKVSTLYGSLKAVVSIGTAKAAAAVTTLPAAIAASVLQENHIFQNLSRIKLQFHVCNSYFFFCSLRSRPNNYSFPRPEKRRLKFLHDIKVYV